jgi:hypothetical protein
MFPCLTWQAIPVCDTSPKCFSSQYVSKNLIDLGQNSVPDSVNAVQIEDPVPTHQRNVQVERLCCQKPVKGVAVV